ncbi:MAG: methylmalonyl Co-A mutase-associated GTPase MeaB [Spirochaetota bacterium]
MKSKSALSVQPGVEAPDVINKKLKNRFQRRKDLEINEYIDGILQQNRSILSQAITLVESTLPAHEEKAQQILEQILSHSGKSLRIGITGVPGVGKSSFIEVLGQHILALGRKLAILAIDPTSQRSGGSILGDKTRMEELSRDKRCFIRPSPAGESLGGVARKTREIIILCEAFGFDTIFVETVGVGQSEVAVHSMVDFFLLLMLAGAGDELQGIKRGIMEMADLIAITKADGDNTSQASAAASEYKSALHLFPPTKSQWIPQVKTCSAIENTGVTEIWQALLDYEYLVKDNGYFSKNRSQQAHYWMHETIRANLLGSFYQKPELQGEMQKMEQLLREEKITSYQAAKLLLQQYQ